MAKGTRTKFYVDLMAIHPEVTGSSELGNIKFPVGLTERFLVDCGMFQEKKYQELNKSFPWNSESIDVAFLTHVHVDHAARFPLLVKNGYEGKIFMTEDSKTLLPLVLTDSAKVIEGDAKKAGQKPLYTQSDVEKTLKQCVACKYGETINATDNIKVTFFQNGHLIGSAIILLQIHCSFENSDGRSYEDINLLFTGDYNNKNTFFDVEPLPDWVKKLPLTIITEATYGKMDSTEVVECFEKKYSGRRRFYYCYSCFFFRTCTRNFI